jgi:hypothetical protein
VFTLIHQTQATMKITIELTEAEVKGIKAYLKDVDSIKATKNDISQFINGVVQSIHAPQESVSDYIKQFELKA